MEIVLKDVHANCPHCGQRFRSQWMWMTSFRVSWVIFANFHLHFFPQVIKHFSEGLAQLFKFSIRNSALGVQSGDECLVRFHQYNSDSACQGA
jgi:hypothetical protein